jgi:glycosyltransferase involved in cell wall biosynthesis
MKVIITSPSLDINTNVSGVSAVANFIIKLNTKHQYIHFEVGKKDGEKRNLGRFFGLLKMYLKWFYLLATTNHFIHFNFPVDKRSIIRDVPMIWMAKLFSKRMVLHLHGGEYLMQDSHPRWVEKMMRIAFSGKAPIITLSAAEEEFIIKKYNCKNVYTLPNCIDLTDAERFDRVTPSEGKLILLFLGRIHVDKGLAYIYEAFTILKQQGVPFKFVLAGKGPDEDEYKQKFTGLLGNDFDFKGIVGGQAKVNAFKESDVFLLPSFYEGLPIALLEAMSFGLVPIATNVGAIGQVIETADDGIMINTKSADDIVNAVIKLSSDRELVKKLSHNAKKVIFKKYNPLAYFDLLNTIYQYE